MPIERRELPAGTDEQLLLDFVRALIDFRRARSLEKWLRATVRTVVEGARAGTLVRASRRRAVAKLGATPLPYEMTVVVGAEQRGSMVCFYVSDTGLGIPSDQLPHLFERFWQADRRDRRGVGLGLSIAKVIVELHAGQIWAESVIGRGTTVFFTVPATTAMDATATDQPPQVRP